MIREVIPEVGGKGSNSPPQEHWDQENWANFLWNFTEIRAVFAKISDMYDLAVRIQACMKLFFLTWSNVPVKYTINSKEQYSV